MKRLSVADENIFFCFSSFYYFDYRRIGRAKGHVK